MRSGNWLAAQIRSLAPLLGSLAVALLIRTTAGQAFSIPTGSATPTLQTGDYVLVSKFAYGYSRYSIPFAPAFLHGRLFGRTPALGDYVVFANPLNQVVETKRVVGLPGDRIQMIGGNLVINGMPCPRRRIADFTERDVDEATGTVVSVRRYHYIETLPGGRTHDVLGSPVDQPEDSGIADNTGVYVVPQGHVFGMGDSRDNSLDSRFVTALGYIPEENLIGKAELQLIALQPGTSFAQFWRWPTAFRLDRLLRPIP